METSKAGNRIHPLVATAAVAVTLVSLVGIAAITGLIPKSYSNNSPELASAAAPSSAIDAPTAKAAAKIANNESAPKPNSPKHVAHAAAPNYSQRPVQVSRAPLICNSCGQVESVQAIQQAAPASGLGVAAGAVLGGVLGNQVGGGNGRTLATIAGAVGGGYAGNEVEKRTRTSTRYEVRVRMENGDLRTFPQSGSDGWRPGDRVEVVNGRLVGRG